jgi:hypothetical protein
MAGKNIPAAIFRSSDALASTENHTIFSLPSFSKRPCFVNANNLGESGKVQQCEPRQLPNSLRRKGLDAAFSEIPKAGMRAKWDKNKFLSPCAATTCDES